VTAPAVSRPPKWWLAIWENVVLRLAVYYALVATAAWGIYTQLPKGPDGRPSGAFGELFGGRQGIDTAVGLGKADAVLSAPTAQVAWTALLAIVAAISLALPIAWTYMFSRQKKGYQQSLVQSILILPIVVAGVVVLVKHSLALAFGLGAIVAAVRFRTSVDDSKDAAFIFLSMAIGVACGVEVVVGAVLSVAFNVVALALWYTDFGRTPARLEGEMAQRRLERAMAIANRTGAFVARLDDEVLKALAPEQLEAIADRAKRRKRKLEGTTTTEERAVRGARPPTPHGGVPTVGDQVLRITTRDVPAARGAVEALLGEYLEDWRFDREIPGTDGTHQLLYVGRLASSTIPQQVLYDVRTRSTPHVMRCELLSLEKAAHA
jgi:uncharacterized membrane protein YhiD involved in acid resistance